MTNQNHNVTSYRTCVVGANIEMWFQVFVDHPCYHRPGNPYGDMYGAFGDNQVLFEEVKYDMLA